MEQADRVAVVDDDLMSLKTVRRVLDRAGIEGEYFRTGQEAFAWLDGVNLPDLILLDVHMPDIGGFDNWAQIVGDHLKPHHAASGVIGRVQQVYC